MHARHNYYGTYKHMYHFLQVAISKEITYAQSINNSFSDKVHFPSETPIVR